METTDKTHNDLELFTRSTKLEARISNSDKLYSTTLGSKIKYYTSIDESIDATILIDELAFMTYNYTIDAVYSYVAYRYGLVPSLYTLKILEIRDFTNITEIGNAVLTLLREVRKIGKVHCIFNTLRQSEDFLMTKLLNNRDKPTMFDRNSAGLLLSKHDKYRQQEIIFGTEIFNKERKEKAQALKKDIYQKSKSTITMQNFFNLVSATMDTRESKIFNYVFKTDFNVFPSLTTFKTLRKDPEKLGEKGAPFISFKNVVVPEVYEVIDTCLQVESCLGTETAKVDNPEDYDDPEKVFKTIEGVASRRYISKYAKGNMVASGKSLNKTIDPFYFKSKLLSTGSTEPLYFIRDDLEAFLKKFYDYEVNYIDCPVFIEYRESLSGSIREEVAYALNCYPIKVWEAYFAWESERGNSKLVFRKDAPKERTRMYDFHKKLQNPTIRQLVQLHVLSNNDEYYMHLFRRTLEYSTEVGLISDNVKTDYSRFNSDLLKAAQILTSQAFIYGDMQKLGTMRSPVISISGAKIKAANRLASTSNRKLDAYVRKNTSKMTLVNWDNFKITTDGQFPMFFSYLSSRAMALVARHHDFADSLLGEHIVRDNAETIRRSADSIVSYGSFYKDSIKYEDETLLSTCYYTKFRENISIGLYSKMYNRHPHKVFSYGYHAWFNNSYKPLESGGIRYATNILFMRRKIKLAERVATNVERERAAARKAEVADLKKERTELESHLKELETELKKYPYNPLQKEKPERLLWLHKERNKCLSRLKKIANLLKNSRTRSYSDRVVNIIEKENKFVDLLNKVYDDTVSRALKRRELGSKFSQEELYSSEFQRTRFPYSNAGLHELLVGISNSKNCNIRIKSNLNAVSYQMYSKSANELSAEELKAVELKYLRDLFDKWKSPFISVAVNAIRFKGSAIALAGKYLDYSGELTISEVSVHLSTKQQQGISITAHATDEKIHEYILSAVECASKIVFPFGNMAIADKRALKDFGDLLESALYEGSNRKEIRQKKKKLKNLCMIYKDNFFHEDLSHDLDSIDCTLQQYKDVYKSYQREIEKAYNGKNVIAVVNRNTVIPKYV